MNVLVLGDLIADISMHLRQFPVQPKDIHRLSYMEVGPGGACNVAIMAGRFGLSVAALGEVGDDGFGLVVSEGLKREGVDIAQLRITPGAHTPVAGVVVDRAGEPAYLGYPGNLTARRWQPEWDGLLAGVDFLFADGWAEYKEIPAMVLKGFSAARGAGVTTVFDPGPGNPDVDGAWIMDALALSDVVLFNRGEAHRFLGDYNDGELLSRSRTLGAKVVVLKRGADGLLIGKGDQSVESGAFPVKVQDATGAGDSLAGAVMYALLRQLPLDRLAVLANATGAAKVAKLGTGHNMPSMAEIGAVLIANNCLPSDYLPRSA